MSDSQSIVSWLRRQFEEVPITSWIVAINLVAWLATFFHYGQIGPLLAGDLSLGAAWHCLSYPLYTPTTPLGIVLTLFVFYWIASSLEQNFGSERFAKILVLCTLAVPVAMWVGMAVASQSLTPQVSLAGLHWLTSPLLCIWAAMNAEATILAFFIIPIKAKYFALLAVLGSAFSAPPPIGLFLALVPAAAWFWARRELTGGLRPSGPSLAQKLKERQKAAKKSRFKVLPGTGIDTGPVSGETRTPLRSVDREKEAKKRSEEQAELDRILDKIRFDGMESLSPEEKSTLESHSRKLNENG